MIRGAHPVLQAFLGTLMTWGLTMAGAAIVFLVPRNMSEIRQRKVLDGALGFAAGVMTAASYWSLLAPAIEFAQESGYYGAEGQWAFVPVAIGFALGGLFVWGTDRLLPHEEFDTVKLLEDTPATFVETDKKRKNSEDDKLLHRRHHLRSPSRGGDDHTTSVHHNEELLQKQAEKLAAKKREAQSWRRIFMLVLAITIHNFPEGLAVGVGFGAIGVSASATFDAARSLAIGIGLQNFPEGLAVSLPLLRLGYSPFRAFWYGQLSGMVEPLAGLLGAAIINISQPLLPYALSFAAGAMIYVVVNDLIPEAHQGGNAALCSWGCMIGFIVMMSMDVGLG